MSHLIDLTGRKFGRLSVIRRVENYRQANGRTRTRWLCKCDCGADYIADGGHLKRGEIVSCGCLKNEKASARAKARKGPHLDWVEDLVGQSFGQLTVMSFAGYRGGRTVWNCLCSCGNHCVVSGNHLKRGNIKSCGCITRSSLEREFEALLKEREIPYETEYKFPDLKGKGRYLLRFDFAIFNSDGSLHSLVELQGEQHYQEEDPNDPYYRPNLAYDEKKRQYCADHGYVLFEIKYDADMLPYINYICETLK